MSKEVAAAPSSQANVESLRRVMMAAMDSNEQYQQSGHGGPKQPRHRFQQSSHVHRVSIQDQSIEIHGVPGTIVDSSAHFDGADQFEEVMIDDNAYSPRSVSFSRDGMEPGALFPGECRNGAAKGVTDGAASMTRVHGKIISAHEDVEVVVASNDKITDVAIGCGSLPADQWDGSGQPSLVSSISGLSSGSGISDERGPADKSSTVSRTSLLTLTSKFATNSGFSAAHPTLSEGEERALHLINEAKMQIESAKR